MSKLLAKSTLLLFFLGLCLFSVYAHDSDNEDPGADVNDQWTCNHDKLDHEEPELVDVEETGLQDAREGRVLASYPNMRMYGYYGFLSGGGSAYQTYMSEKLLPPILAYFEGALRVKYPVSGKFKISSSSICGHSTPSVLRSGVNADFVYIFASESASGTWVASTSTCQSASGSRRPLVGITTVNTALFKVAGNDVLRHERNMLAIMHELTHTLGFSSSLFPHFIDNNGRTLNNHITYSGSYKVINVPVLTERVREHFGCSSLRGGYMENNGAAGAVAGSHWERRQYGFEAMTAYLVYEMKYSALTLAMLEASGWYDPDYSYADEFHWGKGQGCNFMSVSCSNAARSFDEFCSTSARSCANPGRGGGSCSSDTVSDGCRFIHPSTEYDCSNSGAASYARLPDLQTFGRGKGSRCFEGTLSSGRAGSQTTFCFRPTCSGSGGNTRLTLQVGSHTVECEQPGPVTVPGYAGSITCPDPQSWCETTGAPICPRNCMGRGDCVNGFCQCYAGFSGEDCGL